MASQLDLSERRRAWLMQTLLGKLVSKGTKPTLRHCLKRTFEKFDRNASGELDMEEFRLAMDEHLPGIDDEEFLGLAQSFDANGDGVVSIDEFVRRLEEIHRSEEEGVTVTTTMTGSHAVTGQAKSPVRRRPAASGTACRRTSEFVDDGHNRKNPGKVDDELCEFFRQLEARAADGESPATELVLREMERHKSTAMARHLTLPQFKDALRAFWSSSEEERDATDRLLEVLYKKCRNGDYAYFVELMDKHCAKPPDYDSDDDPRTIVGKRIKVRWAGGTFYSGLITKYDDALGHHVAYDDGDSRVYGDILAKTFHFVPTPASVS